MEMKGAEQQDTWTNDVWRPEDKRIPAPQDPHPERLYRPDVLETIEATIRDYSDKLKTLSLDIHAHPELLFEEQYVFEFLVVCSYAHAAYTKFMKELGWKVKEHHHLETAWEATFEHGQGGRVIGVNSEMDALKGIGHACGHNLIGIAGVAVSLGLRAALEKHDIPGKIVLLGTPAEEGGRGKVKLYEKGAYDDMDVCLMCHPAPGPMGSVSLSGCLAARQTIAEFEGHTAHAALSPWEGRNALDAAIASYNAISALRQQLKPTHRIHGIFEGQDWAPNIIPDKAKSTYIVRAPTRSEMAETAKRVDPCFEAGAMATGCRVSAHPGSEVWDLRQNKALGDEVANIILNKYGSIDFEWGISSASTDFGNISYFLPSLHPGYSIPTVPDGGNHTRDFANAAATEIAHRQTLVVSVALAATGLRVLTDDTFFAEVRKAFEDDPEIRNLKTQL